MSAIYLDYNATTPPHLKVVKKVQEVMVESWANPSSGYCSGVKAKRVVETARKQVGDLIKAGNPDQEITFTSGGTEANMMALRSALNMYNKSRKAKGKPHIITTNIEHVAIELSLKKMQIDGEAGKVLKRFHDHLMDEGNDNDERLSYLHKLPVNRFCEVLKYFRSGGK